MNKQQKCDQIAHHVGEILRILGLDPSKGDLQNTPKRVAKMYVNELFYGLDPSLKPSFKLFQFNDEVQEGPVVCINRIQVKSCCEHHLMPFFGYASVCYIPVKGVLGLSKINRIVDFCARKPHVQERLTLEISKSIQEASQSPHVAVRLDCLHFCVCLRGVQDSESRTVTQHLHGDFLTRSDLREDLWKAPA